MRVSRNLAFAALATVALAGCGQQPFEKGGASFAVIALDRNDSCRILVTDAGRASPPVVPFVARIEGCESKGGAKP